MQVINKVINIPKGDKKIFSRGRGGYYLNCLGYPLSSQITKISTETCNFKKYFIEVRGIVILSPMKDDKIILKESRERAIELFATNPDIDSKKVAEMVGVHAKSIQNWRQDPNFHQQVQDRFMVELENEVPSMVSALKREVLAGNVQATRLMFEYMNKLQKNINITIDSPFENWMKKQGIESAEVVQEELAEMAEFKELPPRTDKNNHLVVHKERMKIKNAPNKDKSVNNRNKARRELYKLQKRAKVVGVDPLPARRPTPGQRKAWEKKIIQKEKQASKLLREQAGSSKTPCKPKTRKKENPEIPTQPSS